MRLTKKINFLFRGGIINSGSDNAEKKFKRETKITMATVVAFLITGAVSYGATEKIVVDKGQSFTYDNGTINARANEVGVLLSGANKTGTIKVLGTNAVRVKVEVGGENRKLTYNCYGNNENGMLVSNKGAGFYVAKNGEIYLTDGNVKIDYGTRFKAYGTEKLSIGNKDESINEDNAKDRTRI